MKMKAGIVVMAAALFAGAQAPAEESSLVEHVLNACEGDISQYCNQVTPGEGRLLHCMAAHEDKISDRCGYALFQAATVLEQLSAAIRYVAEACESDINTHCSGVKAGEGRILACLEENKGALGESCKTALADTMAE